jgi:hypothetical protein
MSDDRTSQHLYTEKEIGALLRRASELQAKGSVSDKAGLTLAEIEQVAAEAGIDPRYVRSAATESLRPESPGTKSNILGGPLALEEERVFHGEVTHEQWEAIVQEIRRTFGQSGTATQLGTALEWSTSTEDAYVSVSPRRGRTRVQVTQQHGGVAFIFYFIGTLAAVFGTGISLSFIGAPSGAELALGGVGLAGYAAGLRGLFGSWTGRQRKKIETLLERIEALTRDRETEQATVASERLETPAPAPQIRLSEEPDTESTPLAARTRTRA